MAWRNSASNYRAGYLKGTAERDDETSPWLKSSKSDDTEPRKKRMVDLQRACCRHTAIALELGLLPNRDKLPSWMPRGRAEIAHYITLLSGFLLSLSPRYEKVSAVAFAAHIFF